MTHLHKTNMLFCLLQSKAVMPGLMGLPQQRRPPPSFPLRPPLFRLSFVTPSVSVSQNRMGHSTPKNPGRPMASQALLQLS